MKQKNSTKGPTPAKKRSTSTSTNQTKNKGPIVSFSIILTIGVAFILKAMSYFENAIKVIPGKTSLNYDMVWFIIFFSAGIFMVGLFFGMYMEKRKNTDSP